MTDGAGEKIDLNPQARQMADESMVRNLAAQALAIWPQESRIIASYGLKPDVQVVDIGCGTGEFALRFAEYFPASDITGIDIFESHIEFARRRCREFGERVRFEQGDAFELRFPDDSFDFAVCRHMLQAVPYPERIVDQMIRVTRPGGRLHLIAEDYGMIHLHPTQLDTDVFWREMTAVFGPSTHTDLRIGRRAYTLLKERGLQDVRVDYVHVDTIRVSRDVCAAIIEAWRDGYTEVIAERSRFTYQEVLAFFNDMIACIRNPRGYAVWQVPVVSGEVVKKKS